MCPAATDENRRRSDRDNTASKSAERQSIPIGLSSQYLTFSQPKTQMWFFLSAAATPSPTLQDSSTTG